jgi:hypothetical protein
MPTHKYNVSLLLIESPNTVCLYQIHHRKSLYVIVISTEVFYSIWQYVQESKTQDDTTSQHISIRE